MKRAIPFLVLSLAILLVSCQEERLRPGQDTGRLHIDIGLSIQIHEVNSALKSTQQTENFRVTIYRSDGTEAMIFESALMMPDSIELAIGDYYVEAHSDNNLPAVFENPYYFGASQTFTINGNTEQTVQVICELANTMVSVSYSDYILNNFQSYFTTVSSSLGSLIYTQGETRIGYFRTLPLEIQVELSYQNPDGTEVSKTLSGSIPDPMANRHYEILVDASIDNGTASFQLLLDTTEVPVEIVEITEEPVIPDNGEIAYGELLITEIMYDPAALSDTEGEWFEIYNSSDRTLNLQHLILGRDDLNIHTITDSIELAPGEYLVVQRSVTSTNAASSYVYGSDITLSNTGATLYIFNEGTETEPGALVFSLNYGEAGFPSGTGTSLSLDPGLLNATDAVVGASWCTSTSIYNTGDLGTPGTVNDSCQ